MVKKPKARKEIDHLPDDISFEIFTHLPLKHIFQLKLLSKQWYVLISSTNFMTRKLNLCTLFYKVRSVHRPLIRFRPTPILVSSNTESSGCYFISDQDYIENGFYLRFFPEHIQQDRPCVLGSSNGLLLCGYPLDEGKQNFYFYIICNPLTREWVRLPLYESDVGIPEHESHVLVCESSSSTWNTNPSGFTVVCVPEVTIPTKKFYIRIFSSGTGKWKNCKALCAEKTTMKTKKVVSDQSGCLYWIIESNKIVIYDLKNNVGGSGECVLVDLPESEEEDDLGSLSAARSCISESEGFIFYLRIEIRQMYASVWLIEKEKDDSNEQWSCKVVHKIKLNEMFAGYEWWTHTKIMNVKPLGFSPMDRNIMFLQIDECILHCNILTRRSKSFSIGSYIQNPISSYESGLLPFLATTKPTTIPVIKRA